MANNFLFTKKQNPQIELAVIVPVKDEEDDLINTLNALYAQKDADGNELDKKCYEVLLLTNNCLDNSYALALAYQAQHPDFNILIADISLPKETAHIGTVRRLLMDEAYSRFIENNKPNGIIASTDGDSEVDSTWIYHILEAMGKGIDVVGGRIIPKNTPNLSRLHHLQNVTYRYYVSKLEALINPIEHDPWPRHFQCFGPSVAVTCDVYTRAGRLPILPFLEDEEFRKSLYRIDAKVRLCPNVKVYTSSRLIGKVDFGFSVQLKEWADIKAHGKKVEVETLEALVEKFELKQLLKACWERPQLFHSKYKDLKHIADRFQICNEWLENEFKSAVYFGALWERLELKLSTESNWGKKYQKASIDSVIAQLRNYFYGEREVANGHNLQGTA